VASIIELDVTHPDVAVSQSLRLQVNSPTVVKNFSFRLCELEDVFIQVGKGGQDAGE